jgi:hypothetical protein
MPQCKGTTKSGRKCHRITSLGQKYCSAHRSRFYAKTLALTGASALLGHMLLPGAGGVLAGLAAIVVHRANDGRAMKKRVFVSFDFDNDRSLKEFIVGQARLPESPFEVMDYSLKEAAPERNWEDKAARAIARSDIVFVMLGTRTYRASGVLKEIKIARSLSVPVVQIIGYRDRECPAITGAGRVFSWSWPNLKNLLS